MKIKYRIVTRLIEQKDTFIPMVGCKVWIWPWTWRLLQWRPGWKEVSEIPLYFPYDAYPEIKDALSIIDMHKRETHYLPSAIEV